MFGGKQPKHFVTTVGPYDYEVVIGASLYVAQPFVVADAGSPSFCLRDNAGRLTDFVEGRQRHFTFLGVVS